MVFKGNAGIICRINVKLASFNSTAIGFLTKEPFLVPLLYILWEILNLYG